MRTVFNNRQLAHVWAAQSQATGRGSNMHFDGATIYSYGAHFPIARFTEHAVRGQQVVLFNGDSYSNSTSKHKGHVRSALYGLPVLVIDVPTKYVTPGCPAADCLADFVRRRDAELVKAAKARSHARMHLQYAECLECDATDYADAFGLPAPTFAAFDRTAILAKIAEQRKANAAAEAARVRQRAEEAAKREALYPKVLAAWRRRHETIKPTQGALERPLYMTHAIGAYDKPTALRLSRDGSEVETSRGANVPIDDARKLWYSIRHYQARGEQWLPSVQGAPSVGPFSLREIRADGTAIVGCHTLEYAETLAFATAQGWTA